MCKTSIASSTHSAQASAPTTTPNFAAIAASLGLPYLHQRADGSWAVPSGTSAGAEYTVWLSCPASPTCTCEGFGWRGSCSHIKVARAKAAQASTPAPVLYCAARDAYLVPDVDAAEVARLARVARGRAAVADLCGVA